MIIKIWRSLRPQNLSLRGKLVLSTAFVAVAITSAAAIGFVQAVATSNNLLYAQTANSQGFLSDQIAARLNGIMDFSYNMDINKDFQGAMRTLSGTPGEGDRLNARSDISEIIYRRYYSDIISITVLPVNDVPFVWGTDSYTESAQVMEEALALAREHKGAPAWMPSGRGDGSLLCVREVLSFSDPFLGHLGYIVIRADFERIVEESARSVMMYPGYSIAIYNGGDVIYPPAGGEAVLPLPDRQAELYEIVSVEGERQFITRARIATERTGWDLALGIPYQVVFRAQLRANLIFALGLVGSIIFAGLVAWVFLRRITTQFNLLVEKMNRVRSGNLEPYPYPQPQAGDELGILNTQFDEMTAEFKKVIDDNYVKELLLAQTQLKSLEQQINPHFLYNSLESIRWFAKRGDEEPIAAIAQSLGSLLRQSLSEEQMAITICREVGIVKDYLRIQKIRFPETLVAELEIPEETLEFLVPKMSLQPLVENAIIHSLEENIGVCHIWVRVRLEGEELVAEVENDGSQIEEDILVQVKNGTVVPKGNGIGLINIDTRIKLLYGDRYGLRFGGGLDRAVVSYRIPAATSIRDGLRGGSMEQIPGPRQDSDGPTN